MSLNKNTVRKYIDGFNETDHAQILSCLTDDIEWLMPGAFHVVGRDAFDREIENEATTGNPIVRITRMVEENDVVIAEGTVRVAWRAGGFLNAVFCDVFEMTNTKIKRLTTYQVNLKEQASDDRKAASKGPERDAERGASSGGSARR
jgi:ketosteroid isomerase-like protein